MKWIKVCEELDQRGCRLLCVQTFNCDSVVSHQRCFCWLFNPPGSSSAASLMSLHKLRINLLDLLKRTHQNPWSKTENDGGL